MKRLREEEIKSRREEETKTKKSPCDKQHKPFFERSACRLQHHQRKLRFRCCGSRRHLRGRTAFQADTERIPCCPGALPPVTHSTAFQAGLSCLLFVVDSTKPCSNLLLVLAQQDATLCKCMVGFSEASRVTSYCH